MEVKKSVLYVLVFALLATVAGLSVWISMLRSQPTSGPVNRDTDPFGIKASHLLGPTPQRHMV